jgi:hypothetical protein
VRAYPSGARAPSGYLRGIPRSFLRAARSCSRRCAVRARTRARGVGGSDRVAFTATLCWEGQNVRVAVAPSGRIKERGEEPTQQRAVGKHNERPEVIVAILDSLKVDGAPRPRGHVLRGRRSCTNRERTSATGLAVSSILKMRSPLSMRVMIRRWWRFARTEAAPSPHPPGSSARVGLTPAGPGARKGTGHATRNRPSPLEPCRCRGRPGSSLRR